MTFARESDAGEKYNRPAHTRDAASLILLRGEKSNPLVLMGQRPKSSRFMPGFHVFPGGQFDHHDRLVGAQHQLEDETLVPVSGRCSRRRANSLIWTAIRETWEETGLLIGRPFRNETKNMLNDQSVAMQAFIEARLMPDFDALIYVARAITPVSSPIRFDTRFFVADGSTAFGTLRDTSELLNISWRKVTESFKHKETADVTKFALEFAVRHWTTTPATGTRTIPTRFHRSRQVILRYDST